MLEGPNPGSVPPRYDPVRGVPQQAQYLGWVISLQAVSR